MKKTIGILLSSSLLLLGACGNNDNDNDKVDNPPQNAPVENGNETDTTNNQDTKNDEQKTQTASIPFTSFDLDVDYGNFKSFEVEYENETDGMEAKIEDEVNNRTIKGDEAFQEMQSRFENFKFTKDSSTDEVIAEVMKSFDLKEDYKQFDLEIKYADGTQKEYLK